MIRRAAVGLLDRLSAGLRRLADKFRGSTPEVADDDLGEDEQFEGNVTREAAKLRAVPPPRPRQPPPAEPLRGSVQARLAQRRPRW